MDLAAQLHQLQELRKSGALTEEEFTKAKQILLSGAAATAPQTETSEEVSAVKDHLLRKTAQPSSTTPPKQPDTSSAASQEQTQAAACAPLAPKYAHLEPDEHHQYTFQISPVYRKPGSFLAGRLPTWCSTGTRFYWHLTDRRVVIEPYEVSESDSAIGKALSIGLVALTKALASMSPSGPIHVAAAMEAKEDTERAYAQMKAMKGQWLGIDYKDIAKVEWQKALAGLVRFVKILFTDTAIQPMVFGVAAGNAGKWIALNRYGGHFIEVMGQLLQRDNKESGSE